MNISTSVEADNKNAFVSAVEGFYYCLMRLEQLPKEVQQVLKKAGQLADEEKVDLYLVGGFVRDLLLRQPSQDVDLMVIGDGIDFARKLGKVLNTGPIVPYAEFGTALVPNKDFVIEVATARKERYDPTSRKPQVAAGDLNSDLARRDFTVNAMALRVTAEGLGEFVDIFNGIQDLHERLLRTPLDPETTFSEDPLRMLRAARFAAQLDFQVDKAALQAMKRQRERISIVSQERITDEIIKLLKTNRPSIGFYILQEVGLLELVFPEIAVLGGVEERDGYRHKDVFHHTLKVVDNAAALSPKMRLRFAALVHDIGKPATKKFIPGIGWTYHGHDEVGRKMLNEIGVRMRLPRRLTAYLKKMTRLHLRPIALAQEEVTDSAIRRLIVEAGDYLEELLLLCRADVTSRDPQRIKKYYGNFDRVAARIQEVYEKDRLRAFQSPVRGEEIMETLGIPPGPLVGKIKKTIEEAILDGEIPNTYEAARQYFEELTRKWAAEIEQARKARR